MARQALANPSILRPSPTATVTIAPSLLTTNHETTISPPSTPTRLSAALDRFHPRYPCEASYYNLSLTLPAAPCSMRATSAWRASSQCGIGSSRGILGYRHSGMHETVYPVHDCDSFKGCYRSLIRQALFVNVGTTSRRSIRNACLSVDGSRGSDFDLFGVTGGA